MNSPARDIKTDLTLVLGLLFVVSSQLAISFHLKYGGLSKIQFQGLNRLSLIGSLLSVLGILVGNFQAAKPPFNLLPFSYYIVLSTISVISLYLSISSFSYVSNISEGKEIGTTS